MDTVVLAVRTILSLAVVLGLIWYAGRRLDDSTSGRGGDGVLAAWVRKAGGVVGRAPGQVRAGGRRRAERPAPVVAVVGRQAIGPKASVAVVDVGGQRLVLGVSEAGVSLLTTVAVPGEAVVEVPVAALPEVPAAALPEVLVAAPPEVPAADVAGEDATEAEPATAPSGSDGSSIPSTFGLPTKAASDLVVPDFDEVFAAATADTAATAAPRGLNGSILSPTTWRHARAALRTGPTP